MGKFQPYPGYRDSGIEWAPECPEGWDVVPTFAASVENRRNNSAGAIDNVLSLSYGRIVRRDVETNFGLLPESFNTYQIVQPGHIVMRLTDLQNDKRSLRVGFVEEGGIITSAYLGLQFNQRFRPKFAYYLLHAYDLYKVYYGMGGGLRQTMKFSDLKWLPLFCPPVSEQENIAAFLDHETAKIDRLIARQERLIELLKEKRQAVISHAVTKGLNPDAPMKDSGVEWLGEVPAHWEVSRAKFVSRVFVPQRNKPELNEDDGLPWVTMEDIKGDFVGSARYRVSATAQKDAGSRVLKSGAVIASCVGTFGVASVNREDVIINQQLQGYIPERIEREFLREVVELSTSYFEQVGTAATLTYVNQEGFDNLPVLAPPSEEQKAIIDEVVTRKAEFDRLVGLSEKAICLLKEHRTALISAAVTGKIDVRGWQKPNNEPQEAATAASA